MINKNAHPQFSPSEIWTPQDEVEGPIQAAIDEMNQTETKTLVSDLQKNVETADNGVVYAVLKGDNPEEYSESDALVVLNPFANAATPNQLVRAEFIRRVAKRYDVRDEAGKLKPVVMLASPGLGGSKLNLSRDERNEVRNGELGPVAKELLQAVSSRDIGRVTLLGFSQGADVALAGARSAYGANLDTAAVAVGDPAGVEARGRLGLLQDFSKAGTKDLKQAIEATGLKAQEVIGLADFARFGASFALKSFNRKTLYSALGRDTFESRLQEILNEGTVDKLIVGYGADSKITKPEHIEPALASVDGLYGDDNLVTSIRVEGAKHTWGDQLTLLAKLYMRAAAQ